MLSNPIGAFLRALRGEPAPRPQPAPVRRPTVGPWPPEVLAPPVVPERRETTYRKGKVLRRSEYSREGIFRPDVPMFQEGGPRLVFAVKFDDREGHEVITVDQKVTPGALVVQAGDPVVVSYVHSLACPLIDWIFVERDWQDESVGAITA
jgi:hypothetical protein